MLRGAFRALLVAALVLFAAAGPAFAQVGPGELVVTVIDADTKTALENAELFLIGPVQTSALTNKTGILRFEEVPPGLYRARIQLRGYQTSNVNDFEVNDGRRVTLTVALVPNQVIGRIVAHSSTTANSTDINENSALRRISDSLYDALGQLAGVNVSQNSNGTDGAVTISLRGRDESQTGISIGGIPISGASQGAVLRALGSDLFSGASVDFSGNAGNIAGRVNYNLLEPTKQWVTRFSDSYSTFDRSSFSSSITGSVGKLGIAAQYSHRSTGSPFDGLTYEDQSGTTYQHDGGARLTAELLRLRYALTERTTLNAGLILSNSGGSPACPVLTELVVCGYGVGLKNGGHFMFGSMGLQSLIGNVALKIDFSTYGGSFIQNRLQAVIAGTPAPSEDIYQYQQNAGTVALNATLRRHALALSYNASAERDVYTPVDLLFSMPSLYAPTSSSLNLTDTYKINTKFSVRGGISSAYATGANASALESAGANWQPSKSDTFDASAQFGSAQPTGTGNAVFSEPSLLTFTCDGVTRVGGPGDPGTSQSSTSYNASWTHTWRTGLLTGSLYRQVQDGQNFYAPVPFASEPAGYFPAGYIAALQQAWSRPLACGGLPFDINRLYVSQSLAGTLRRYEGLNVSGRFNAGRNVVIFPNYAVTAATLLSGDPRLASPFSYVITGSQLPYRPLHTASVVVDALQPKAGLEWIANAQYAGPNNGQRLNAYTQVNFGVTRALSRGALTAFVSNLFNTDSGIFYTTQNAYPLPLAGGGSIAQNAQPLTPRSFTVQYTVRTARH
jgi:hypothetical protein